MRKTTSRVLWILVGVLLVITGIACFAHPAATLGSLAILLGIAMLFSGVVDLVIFATARDAMYGSGWFLLDGVLTILLSIFILATQRLPWYPSLSSWGCGWCFPAPAGWSTRLTCVAWA